MSKLNIRKKFSIYDTNNASLDEGMKKINESQLLELTSYLTMIHQDCVPR